MTIPIHCDCGRLVHLPDDAAGKPTPCPECGRTIYVPAASAEEVVALAEPADQDKPVFHIEGEKPNCCPKCQQPMEAGAVLCTQCGWHQTLARFITTQKIKEEPPASAAREVASGLWLLVQDYGSRYRVHLGVGLAVVVVGVLIIWWVGGAQQEVLRPERLDGTRVDPDRAADEGRGIGALLGQAKTTYDRAKRQADQGSPEMAAAAAQEMYLNAQTEHRQGHTDKAIATLRALLAQHATAPVAAKARRLLEELESAAVAPATEPAAGPGPPAAPKPVAEQPLSAVDKPLKEVADLLQAGRRGEALEKLAAVADLYEGTGVGWAAAELLKRLRAEPPPAPAPSP